MVPVDRALINLHIEIRDYFVFTDPMVRKVFSNLANNVIKHSKATNLVITTVEEKDYLLVVFQDDGIVIKEAGVPGRRARFELVFSSGQYKTSV
jgi:signal transduction histidine kinase